MEAAILYQNSDATITLLDIPKSVECGHGLTKGLPRHGPNTRSIKLPYAPLEPKSAKAIAQARDQAEVPPIRQLLLQAHLRLSLEAVKENYHGPFFLSRRDAHGDDGRSGGRGFGTLSDREHALSSGGIQSEDNQDGEKEISFEQFATTTYLTAPFLYQNTTSSSHFIQCTDISPDSRPALYEIPARSAILQGSITALTHTLLRNSPARGFDLVILDPPWPNQSARRAKAYSSQAYDAGQIKLLLASIPVRSCLAEDDGMVAVWITNKPQFRELLLGSEEEEEGGQRNAGLFGEWGIQLVEEWVWLKIAENGDLICALDSTWRKPYEILLVGRKRVNSKIMNDEVRHITRRVIVGVPSVHSQKPNLKALFAPVIGKKDYKALEIFARNLTAGWWAWGDEALKFQEIELNI